MSQLTPIFESLRQKEDLPCSYPLHMHAPSYHWVNKKKRKKTLSTVFIFCCRWCDVTRVFVSIPLYRFNHFFFFIFFFILFSPSPSVFFSLLRYIIFPSFFNVFFLVFGWFFSLFLSLTLCRVVRLSRVYPLPLHSITTNGNVVHDLNDRSYLIPFIFSLSLTLYLRIMRCCRRHRCKNRDKTRSRLSRRWSLFSPPLTPTPRLIPSKLQNSEEYLCMR